MKKYQILLLLGGRSSEHEISLVSGNYVESELKKTSVFEVHKVVIGKDNIFRDVNGDVVELDFKKNLVGTNKKIAIDYVVPCIHGNPGETGDIQSMLDILGLPYFGCGAEASKLCFNKISTKLWFNALGIPNTPFLFLNDISEMDKARAFMKEHGNLYIKAASQGSSIGTYPASDEKELIEAVTKAFNYSHQVVVEIFVKARELEVSTYEMNGEIHASLPGEIKTPSQFYSYEEKYAKDSKTTTDIVALNVPKNVQDEIRAIAIRAFKGLKLRHLSRIDFFYTENGTIYLNEINTFPGMTPISMFPKMLINNGHNFSEFLAQNIKTDLVK